MKNFKVSVIMGMHNCESTLNEAIDSIVAQTISDWELILCDDGSTDGTFEIAKQYKRKFPEKIKLLQNNINKGLNYTLNRCLENAQGEFIARMDADDRCAKERFAKELEVFKKEPDISIVSSDMEFFDETGVWGKIQHPEYPQDIDFVHGSPFCHAPCMVRKSAYDKVKGYSEAKKLLRVEDYHLWVKMYAAGLRGKNLHLPLYQMRDDRNAYARRKFRYRINEAYVRFLAVHMLKLGLKNYVFVLRPILVGLCLVQYMIYYIKES